MSSLCIKNASVIVTCDDQDSVLENSSILIEDGVIRSIGQQTFSADEILDASGCMVYPGLINTHHHLYQTFSRNLPQVQNMELFEWLTTLYEIWKNLDSSIIYHSSVTGMGELLKTGCTTCFDHHYVFPGGSSVSLLEAQFEAARQLGIRMYASRGSMDLSKKDGGLPPDSVVQSVDEILKDSRNAVEKFHNPAPFSMNMVALAPCSPFSAGKELYRQSALLARDLRVRLHTHLCETLDEENYVLEKYGKRPLSYMEGLGWTGSDVWYAHGIHFNDEELKILAETKTGVAHCPISNMKLSSGICRIPEMLKLATKGSAAVLGRSDIGSLEPGKAGDLFLIRKNRLELVGADLDPKSMLGTVGFKGAVDYTVVNGKIVVRNGKLTGIDEEKAVYEGKRAVNEYLNR